MDIYTAPSDIDRHVRDAAARTALVQHGRGCPCQPCTDRRIYTIMLNAACDMRDVGAFYSSDAASTQRATL